MLPGLATSTSGSNMVVSVFQDPVPSSLMPGMAVQTDVGMEREVAGQTMSTECQVFVKIFALLLFSNYWVTSHYLSLGGGGVEGFSGITWFLWGNRRVIIRRQQSIKG